MIQSFNFVKEALNRVIGVFDFVVSLFGIWPAKKLRVRIVILRDERGLPVMDEPAAQRAFDETARILGRAAQVEMVPVGWRVVTAPHGAPTAALDVRCTDGAWSDDLGEAGSFYRSIMAKTAVGTIVGYGAPVTVFVVRSISDKNGCSLGMLTDYVTVEAREALRTRGLIAHEIAHACGLLHSQDKANIMYPTGPGATMSRFQTAVFRNSRHVTYW
ncbi:MAG: matrixin family metalloprotease [Chloroflexota bacterium]